MASERGGDGVGAEEGTSAPQASRCAEESQRLVHAQRFSDGGPPQLNAERRNDSASASAADPVDFKESAAPTAQTGKRNPPNRFVASRSPEQVQAMKDVFVNETCYPSKHRREQLGQKINLTAEQINTWFKNKRFQRGITKTPRSTANKPSEQLAQDVRNAAATVVENTVGKRKVSHGKKLAESSVAPSNREREAELAEQDANDEGDADSASDAECPEDGGAEEENDDKEHDGAGEEKDGERHIKKEPSHMTGSAEKRRWKQGLAMRQWQVDALHEVAPPLEEEAEKLRKLNYVEEERELMQQMHAMPERERVLLQPLLT